MLPTDNFHEQTVCSAVPELLHAERQSVHEIQMKVELQDDGCTEQDSE